ncbi:MAG: BMFP domain-containing protein YqiC [Lentisphaeria bacterium]|jgi:BMFP domain-containing protein YqiC
MHKRHERTMIEQIAKNIFNEINQQFSTLGESTISSSSASQIRALIEAGLKKMNLVTREEFDAQQAVLLRTREKLDALEAKLSELESKTTNSL